MRILPAPANTAGRARIQFFLEMTGDFLVNQSNLPAFGPLNPPENLDAAGTPWVSDRTYFGPASCTEEQNGDRSGLFDSVYSSGAPNLLGPRDTMKRGSNQAVLAIEVRTTVGSAFCGRERGAADSLVGSECTASSRLDGGSEPAAGAGGISTARRHAGSRFCRRGHHRQPDVFHSHVSLQAVANGADACDCRFRAHLPDYPAR